VAVKRDAVGACVGWPETPAKSSTQYDTTAATKAHTIKVISAGNQRAVKLNEVVRNILRL